MDESLMNWKLAEIIDSWDEDDHDPTPDEEAAVSILLLIESNADDLLILSNKYARADAAVISGIYALDAMRRRNVPNSVQSRFTRKLRLASCRLFDIQPSEMDRLMNNRLGVFSGLIRSAANLTSIADEASLLFSYDIKHDRYVDFSRSSPVILMDFSTQTQILMESKAFFGAVFPLVVKSMEKFGAPIQRPTSSHTYQPPSQPAPSRPVYSKPSTTNKRRRRFSPIFLFVCSALILATVLFTILPDDEVPDASPVAEPQPTLQQVARPPHGKIFEDLTVGGVAPFSVTGTGDIYLVLDPIDLSASVKNGMGQASAELIEGYNALRVFLRSGKSFETDVPLGKYEVYYATGDAWYGEEELFGPDTQYYKCDEIFDFTMDDEGYNGWTLTLTAVYNGNLDTDPIDAEDFPK